MKQIKIALILFICVAMLFQCNLVKAINILPKEAVGFSGTKTYREIHYQGKLLEIPIVKGTYKNEEFPIYALTKEKHELDSSTAFYTYTDNIIQNDEIRKILLYGYPERNYEKLNCSNEEEAYLVTQIAVWNQYYHYDLSKFSLTKENKYPNIIKNLQAFLEDLSCRAVDKKNPHLSMEERIFEWQDENEYELSKNYQVFGDMKFEKYEIKIESNYAEYIKVVNEANEPQKSFKEGEKFKIVVPNNLDINFKITVRANFATKPVKFGNGFGEYWESYLFLGEIETIETTLLQTSIHKLVEPINPDESKEPSKDQENSNEENNKQENNNGESNQNTEKGDEVNNKKEEENKENDKETENLEGNKNNLDNPIKKPNQEQTNKDETNENLGTNRGEKEESKPQETINPAKPNVESNEKEKEKIKEQENKENNKEENSKSENSNQANELETNNTTNSNNHNKNQNSKTENVNKSSTNSSKQNKKLPKTGC